MAPSTTKRTRRKQPKQSTTTDTSSNSILKYTIVSQKQAHSLNSNSSVINEQGKSKKKTRKTTRNNQSVSSKTLEDNRKYIARRKKEKKKKMLANLIKKKNDYFSNNDHSQNNVSLPTEPYRFRDYGEDELTNEWDDLIIELKEAKEEMEYWFCEYNYVSFSMMPPPPDELEKECQLELMNKWTNTVNELDDQLEGIRNKFVTHLNRLFNPPCSSQSSNSTDNDSETEFMDD